MKTSQRNLSVGFLFDDTLDSNDGVAQYVKNLGAWLTKNGHRVCYLVGESKTASWRGGKVYSLSKNLRLPWGGNRLSIPLLPKTASIKNILESEHFDILHVQVPYSPFMAEKIINLAHPKTAVVGTVHVFPANFLAFWGSKLLKFIYGKSLKRFDEMLSVSSAAQAYAQKSFGLETKVLPNVVDLPVFKAAKPLARANQTRIVFLGRLVRRKGCKYLLLAFDELHKSLPDAQLIIAGDGPERKKLEKLTKKLKLDEAVDFLGYIKEAEKPTLLAKADIACFPSLYGESFGIVLIEAMAAGAGVVMGGDNPGYASVLGENSEALFDPRDSSAFAARLEKFLSHQDLVQKLHMKQQELVKQYDVAVVGNQLMRIYMEAIASRRQKP